MTAIPEVRPKIEFDEANHLYFIGGKPMPAVSEILRPLLDFSRIPPDALEFARERGTAVHKATELHDLGMLDEDSIDDHVRPYLDAWKQFRSDTGFYPTLIEHRVYSETYGYCGTIDRQGVMTKLAGSPGALLDIKTPVQLGPAVGIQLAAYQEALRRDGILSPLRFAVQLRNDGLYRLVSFTDKSDFGVFIALMTVRKWRDRNP
jgi:hypothetical protein